MASQNPKIRSFKIKKSAKTPAISQIVSRGGKNFSIYLIGLQKQGSPAPNLLPGQAWGWGKTQIMSDPNRPGPERNHNHVKKLGPVRPSQPLFCAER